MNARPDPRTSLEHVAAEADPGSRRQALTELHERGAEGGLTDSEHRRLESIKVGRDRAGICFRQRRALREVGFDADAARVRDPEVVERHEQ